MNPRRPSSVALPLAFLTLAAFGCGSSSAADQEGMPARDGGVGTNGDSGTGDAGSSTPPGSLEGVWKVHGTDARGAYTGRAEVRRSEGGDLLFLRAVKYDALVVEGDRELHWVWTGSARGDGVRALDLAVTLDNRDFVVRRGALTRSIADTPASVTGRLERTGGSVAASYGAFGSETWDGYEKPGAAPIFAEDRRVIPAHTPPSSADKTARFTGFQSFQTLPDVAPYVGRPEFQAAVHGHVLDRTDFAFYRENPKALRVVNKGIDAISLQETKSRADAFRATLAAKAQGFAAEIESEFLDPATGMLLDGAPIGFPKEPHFSAALWTGTVVAAELYRFQVTGEPAAKAQARKSLDGILKLQEVTGNWSEFARAIRVAKGITSDGWRTGAGALSGLEWLPGGNNDMMKGLYLAYVMGHDAFCKSAGEEALCARIRINAQHLADDVNVDRGADELDSPWLASVVSSAPLDVLKYQAKAQAAWVVVKPTLLITAPSYDQGIADWSGLNLAFVGGIFHGMLAEKWNVGGDAKTSYKAQVDATFKTFAQQRLPLWNLIVGAYGSGPDAAATDDAKWRLREMPFPKPMQEVDLRIRPDFSLSPYPSLPWKNDWTTTDRTQALRTMPLFAEGLDLYRFRLGLVYRGGSETIKPPAPEYLLAYWFGRRFGLISAAD